MVQPLLVRIADVHRRPFADRLQALEDLDVFGGVLAGGSGGHAVSFPNQGFFFFGLGFFFLAADPADALLTPLRILFTRCSRTGMSVSTTPQTRSTLIPRYRCTRTLRKAAIPRQSSRRCFAFSVEESRCVDSVSVCRLRITAS